jgi:hypothetical protein
MASAAAGLAAEGPLHTVSTHSYLLPTHRHMHSGPVCCLVSCLSTISYTYRLSFSELKEAASSRAARKAYHAHLAPWPRQEPSTTAAAAAAADAVADGSALAASVSNGSVAHAAVGAGFSGGAGRGGAGFSEVAVGQLMPWDTAEFTDDEVREKLRQVIGDIF